MARHVFEAVLCLRLGPIDREFDARITYQGGPFQADIETVEVRVAEGWIPVPGLTVYLSLAIVLGRAVLFLRDVRARSRGRSKSFPGERFDHDRTPKP